jgi:hypothetical protein
MALIHAWQYLWVGGEGFVMQITRPAEQGRPYVNQVSSGIEG